MLHTLLVQSAEIYTSPKFLAASIASTMIRPRRCSSTGACWMGFDSLTIDAAPVTPCWYGMVPSNRWDLRRSYSRRGPQRAKDSKLRIKQKRSIQTANADRAHLTPTRRRDITTRKQTEAVCARAKSGSALAQRSAARAARSSRPAERETPSLSNATRQTWKELPQPQVDFTCGLLNLNPAPSKDST